MSMKTDIRAFLRSLDRAKDAAIEAGRQALDQGGEHVLGEARRFCPMDTGSLRDSGTTLPAEVSRDRVSKVVGFDTNYAAAVHERTDMTFSTTRNPEAQNKYLERAVRENVDAVREMTIDAIKGAL